MHIHRKGKLYERINPNYQARSFTFLTRTIGSKTVLKQEKEMYTTRTKILLNLQANAMHRVIKS